MSIIKSRSIEKEYCSYRLMIIMMVMLIFIKDVTTGVVVIQEADDNSSRFKMSWKLSRCIWRCNKDECSKHLATRHFGLFGVCIGMCVQRNCQQYLLKHGSDILNSLYICTLDCTKSSFINGIYYR